MSEELMPHLQFTRQAVDYKDAEGHTLYRDVYYVTIQQRGSKDSVTKVAEDWLSDLATKGHDRSGFDQNAAMYAMWHEKGKLMFDMFKKGEEIPPEGMPLSAFPAFSPAELLTCKAVHILTLEHLAEANEQALQYMGPGARSLKMKAGKLLENYNTGKAAEENTTLRLKLEALTEKYEELMNKVALLMSEDKTEHTSHAEPGLMETLKAMQDQITALSQAKKPGRPKLVRTA